MPAVIIRKVTVQECREVITALLDVLDVKDRHQAHLIAADPTEPWDRRRRAYRLARWEYLLDLPCEQCPPGPTA